ncbi:MAG: hypothetical protein OEP95_11890, partial [Myxococcales bacterium]|nr:hypothetical protein [Myxococcales bacterium]
LIPTGPWLNFVLFEIGGREITFQTQLPWVLMVPLFSALVIRCYRRYGPGATGALRHVANGDAAL